LAANISSLQTTQFWQRTRIRCRQHNFSRKCWFTANNTISTANVDSLQTTQNFNSECWFAANNTISAANADSLQTSHFQHECWFAADNTKFQQWMLIRCKQHNFGSKCGFAADITLSAANTSSLQTTYFRQQTRIRYRQHKFGSKHLHRCGQHNSVARTWFTADNTVCGGEH
jgi:hypothetical protein